ncbi:hypothetical protein DV515_00019532, partial [Chloebia gouldiae]
MDRCTQVYLRCIQVLPGASQVTPGALQPPFVVTLDEVELIHFERVHPGVPRCISGVSQVTPGVFQPPFVVTLDEVELIHFERVHPGVPRCNPGVSQVYLRCIQVLPGVSQVTPGAFQPPFVVTLDEVELIHFERVHPGVPRCIPGVSQVYL